MRRSQARPHAAVVNPGPALDGKRRAAPAPWVPSLGLKGRLRLASVVAVVVIWHAASLLAGDTSVSHEPFVPTAVDLVRGFPQLAAFWDGGLGVASTAGGGNATAAAALALAKHSLASVLRLVAGLAWGTVVAVALAVLVSWSGILRRALHLPAHAARMFPLLALSPLFGLWFGNGELGTVAFVAFGTFATVFVVALTAIENVPGYYRQYACSLGASRARAYFTVVLPAALPGLRGGLMLALGLGWSVVIAAEFLGQDAGLGTIVARAVEFSQSTVLALVGTFTVLYAALSVALARRVLDRLLRWEE